MANLATLARVGDLNGLRDALGKHDLPGVVDELERLDAASRAVAFQALPRDRALAVLKHLDPPLQRELLDRLRGGSVSELLEELNPDDRSGLLDQLPRDVAARLLAGLSPDEQAMTRTLLGYRADSVGRRMTPQVVSVPTGVSVAEALDSVRRQEPDAETIYTVPVVDDGRRLRGVTSLRRLLVTDPAVPVTQLMAAPIAVEASADQEVAARLIRDHGLLALPVVDTDRRLVGMFTVDDAMRVLEAEESEDIARAGGAEPLRRPYLSTGIFKIVRSRIVWLLVLIAAATLTVNVLDYFEQTLAAVVELALFVPLLIGTAGNTGSQAATTVVRAMAVGDVRFGELPRVLARESIVGLLLGAALAAVGFVPAALVAGLDIAVVVALALLAVCTLATTVGTLTPMVVKRLGLDPAVVSAPFITTFVDATGLVVYFLLAQVVLL